jgi:hypothetical protein
VTTQAGQEKKAGEEPFFVALRQEQLDALRQEAAGQSTLSHVELDEETETFWAEIGNRLDAAKPQSTVTGLVEALEKSVGALHDLSEDPVHLRHTFAECPDFCCVNARAALSAYKQEVE